MDIDKIVNQVLKETYGELNNLEKAFKEINSVITLLDNFKRKFGIDGAHVLITSEKNMVNEARQILQNLFVSIGERKDS